MSLFQRVKEYRTCWAQCPVSACVALTFAPTALPRLMAFFSLCCPPEEGESTQLDPGLELVVAAARRVEDGPGLEVWGLCCCAMEFSNILWSTVHKRKMERERAERERERGVGEYTVGLQKKSMSAFKRACCKAAGLSSLRQYWWDFLLWDTLTWILRENKEIFHWNEHFWLVF